MKRLCANIDEFFAIKDRCVFCKSKLKSQFRNFSVMHDDIPVVVAKKVDDKFCFRIQYVSQGGSLDADVEINTGNNIINFFIPNKLEPDPRVQDFWFVKNIFEGFGPHIELYCNNKECKRKYYIASDVFKCEPMIPESNQFKLSRPQLYMESFSVNKFWVQNDWLFNSTNIYVRDNPDLGPIRVKLMDLESMDEEKLLTRIRTLVTFS